MPKDGWGEVKIVSLKAWLKRNDSRHLIDDSYIYGDIKLLNELCSSRLIMYINKKGLHDVYEDYVDEMFHRQLIKCEEMEHKYFLEHDEYSILKQKFRDKNYNTTFGVHIGTWSSGRICVHDESGNERDITIDELKYLLSKYDELDSLVEKITLETNIEF